MTQLNIASEEEITKLKDLFVKQLYLKRTKIEIEGQNEPQMNLSWGSRSFLEIDKKEMLLGVAKIMHKSPHVFANQYQEVFGRTSMNQNDVYMLD